MNIFVYNPSTFLVELDKNLIASVKEFKALITRDKGIKGDVQARLKLQATREFTFIYHYCDYRSLFINYTEKDRREQALKNAELDPKLKIEKDEELVAAIEVYIALQETPALKMLNSLKEGLHTSRKVVDKVREDLEKTLDNMSLDEIKVEVDGRGKQIIVDPVDRIVTRLTSLINISNTLPKTLTTIEELELKVKTQLADAPQLRGKANKGFREDAPITSSQVVSLPNPMED